MTEHAEKPTLVLRQNRRVEHLVWVRSVRGASHTKSSMKSCAIQRRIVYLALSAGTRYFNPHPPLRDFLSLARERIEVRIVTYWFTSSECFRLVQLRDGSRSTIHRKSRQLASESSVRRSEFAVLRRQLCRVAEMERHVRVKPPVLCRAF